jgi:hypothetical protein
MVIFGRRIAKKVRRGRNSSVRYVTIKVTGAPPAFASAAVAALPPTTWRSLMAG